MRKLTAALILALVSMAAGAQVIAFLQGRQMVRTVSHVLVWECTYQIPGGQRFTMLMPQGQMCAPTVQSR